MTNPMINPQPNYSGVTIQITNPAVNIGGASKPNINGQGQYCSNQYCTNPQYYSGIGSASGITGTSPVYNPTAENPYYYNPAQQGIQAQALPGQAYPAQYYLNNYNYQNNGQQEESPNTNPQQNLQSKEIDNNSQVNRESLVSAPPASESVASTTDEVLPSYKEDSQSEVQDFTKSNNIIDELNQRQEELKAQQKNTKEKRVVALTNEYIMSLENYLNNQNSEIRLMASKEILKRLDEDKSRFDDAALNALLNKMLQDPSKLIRVAAMSAFASRLACGNDYTVQLLKNMQANPSADKEDILQAADILLKMSSSTELKQVPVPESKQSKNIEREVEPEPNIKPIDRPKEV